MIPEVDGFRDTLENLRKIQAPQATAGMQLRTNISEDEVFRKALQAYRDIRHLNQREPIYHAHQIMSHPVTTVLMNMNILAARRYFQQKKYQQMPVINV